MWPPFYRLSLLAATGFLSIVPVIGCEGECIVGITNAFLGNYSAPIRTVFTDLTNEIRTQLLSHPLRQNIPRSPIFAPLSHLLSMSHDSAYSSLETAIFPEYFHGKCQRLDPANPSGPLVNPPGCPNPDCPVVCGTPGSMVHFYDKLQLIAFNGISQFVTKQLSNDSMCGEIERSIMEEATRVEPTKDVRYIGPRRNIELFSAKAHSDLTGRLPNRRRERDTKIRKRLRAILNQFSDKLRGVCGGTDKLPNCSWKKEMKQYLLTFP